MLKDKYITGQNSYTDFCDFAMGRMPYSEYLIFLV